MTSPPQPPSCAPSAATTAARRLRRGVREKVKQAGLWALGPPTETGRHGLPLLDYVYVDEVVGRSELAMVAVGTHSLQDSIMLKLHASPSGETAT